jgi:hypothetical protein
VIRVDAKDRNTQRYGRGTRPNLRCLVLEAIHERPVTAAELFYRTCLFLTRVGIPVDAEE